jgi:hypothetical protein
MAWCEQQEGVHYVLGLSKNERLKAEIASEMAQARQQYLESEKAARPLYEELYCARGEMENRLKEQLVLFADRASTAYLRSNQIRLYSSALAYVLMEALRRLGLNATDLAQAQCDTIRLKVLKIGACIRITVRRVWVSMAGGYPYAEVWAHIWAQLQQVPLRA